MTDLDDDVARIAALRGKRREDYVDAATGNYRTFKQHHVPDQVLAAMFIMGPNGAADLREYDELPATARLFIREQPVQISATAYRAALAGIEEEALETAVQSLVPGQVDRWLRRHYGSDHPNLRRRP